MKGFVPTPAPLVDLMVEKLFRTGALSPDSTLLDPGCGEGEFIEGVIRWFTRRNLPLIRIVGIEGDPNRAAIAAGRYAAMPRVEIRETDFLQPLDQRFDYIIGNPPYVSITALSVTERDAYRSAYATAKGRFDLYMLFYEQALRLLNPGGRLVFITPEKFVYVDTARALRHLLQRSRVDELHFVDERAFGDLVTYPLVTTVSALAPSRSTTVIHRDGTESEVRLESHASWLPGILGTSHQHTDLTLADVCLRVSCGVATGADSAFVVKDEQLSDGLRQFAHATLAGRQITEGVRVKTRDSMLVPYDSDGRLIDEAKLGELGRFLSEPERREQLLARTCVARKPWYAFHENPPMREILRPKLLCKDITASPFFVMDRTGDIVPRHSTYYLVPVDPADLDALAEHLNSAASREWLRAHCQRAANGFLRLQSHVLKRLPVPASLGLAQNAGRQLALAVEALPA